MSRSVVHEEWCANFKVKVTVKGYIIKIWLFTVSSKLLILLQPDLVWWYVFISQSVLWENWIDKVKVTAKVQNVLFGPCHLNHWNFCDQTWCADASSWTRVSCRKNDVLTSRSRSQWGLVQSKYDSFYCIFWTADIFATKLRWYIIINWNILWENWIAVFKVKVTAKTQNVNECFSSQYFLNHLTFCDLGDGSSWARASCEKVDVPTSRSRSQCSLV